MNNNLTCHQDNKAEWLAGNLALRPVFLNKGKSIEPHPHDFDHVTFVLNGSVSAKAISPDFEKCGCKREGNFYDAGQKENQWHFVAPAKWIHSFTALEDNTVVVCCFPAVYVEDGVVRIDKDGWRKYAAETN